MTRVEIPESQAFKLASRTKVTAFVRQKVSLGEEVVFYIKGGGTVPIAKAKVAQVDDIKIITRNTQVRVAIHGEFLNPLDVYQLWRDAGFSDLGEFYGYFKPGFEGYWIAWTQTEEIE
ncbi:MAG: hypothetical protein JSW58_08660 [Candidatus Latescibacterota bacterium]|nr:MAG: hypothetical protein JSW58_08660 [Candidatus Latescibacterota bacterium]